MPKKVLEINNLKKLSGGKLENFLMTATNNVFKGLLVGFVLTVVTHSSAATTVIVVGLVGAGILSLKNAIPIIMGANVGTTINSQILRLAGISTDSILSIFTPECLAPILLILGFIIIEKAKKQKTKDIGNLIMGLGLIFTGMITMLNIAETFSNLSILKGIIKTLSNPILGVLAGTIVTAIVQSSSATIGILQALSATGIITYATTIPIVLGQNIGTCVTSILASVGGNTNSKRVAAIHLYFNLIGTIIFLIVIYSYQHYIGFSFWNKVVDMGKIADFHTIFNVISTIILLPFISLLEKLAIVTIRDKNSDSDDALDSSHLIVLNKLDDKFQTIPSIALTNSVSVIQKMAEIASSNFERSISIINRFDSKILEKIQTRENNIDKMEKEVTRYLVKLENQEITKEDNKKITALLNIESEFEKIGDYAFRMSKVAENINENDIKFSEEAQKELENAFNITKEAIDKSIKVFRNKNVKQNIEIEALKQFIDEKKEEYKLIHIKRLKEGNCNVESGISFIEILNICDSIVNHCLNISIAISNYTEDAKFATKHDYRTKLYKKNNKEISNKIKMYKKRYQ